MIISDIDDFILLTSKALKRMNINKKKYFFNDIVFSNNKARVTDGSILTEWGKHVVDIIKSGEDYLLLTSANDRHDELCLRFGVDDLNIIQCCSDVDKIKLLNNIGNPFVYADDKLSVLSMIDNKNAMLKRVVKNMLIDYTVMGE